MYYILNRVFGSLNVFGFFLLSAQLLTFCFVDSVKRHPVAINVVATALLYSAWQMFSGFAYLIITSFEIPSGQKLSKEYDLVMDCSGQGVVIIFVSALLAMIVHLGFTMRSAFKPPSPQTEKQWTALLVSAPYFLSFLALGSLRPELAFSRFLGYLPTAISILTGLLDIIFFALFIHYRRIMQQAKAVAGGGFTLSFGIRLLILCIVRLAFTFVSLADTIVIPNIVPDRPTAAVSLLDDWDGLLSDIEPLVVGIFFLRKDVWLVWSSCILNRHKPGTDETWAVC